MRRYSIKRYNKNFITFDTHTGRISKKVHKQKRSKKREYVDA